MFHSPSGLFDVWQARAAEPTSSAAWTATAALHRVEGRRQLAHEAAAMACALGGGAEPNLMFAAGGLQRPAPPPAAAAGYAAARKAR